LLKRCHESAYTIGHHSGALKPVEGDLANLGMLGGVRIGSSHPVASLLVSVTLTPLHDLSARVIFNGQVIYGT